MNMQACTHPRALFDDCADCDDCSLCCDGTGPWCNVCQAYQACTCTDESQAANDKRHKAVHDDPKADDPWCGRVAIVMLQVSAFEYLT